MIGRLLGQPCLGRSVLGDRLRVNSDNEGTLLISVQRGSTVPSQS